MKKTKTQFAKKLKDIQNSVKRKGNPKYVTVRVLRRRKAKVHQTTVYKLKEELKKKGVEFRTFNEIVDGRNNLQFEFKMKKADDEKTLDVIKKIQFLIPDDIKDPDNVHFIELIGATGVKNTGIRLSYHFLGERITERLGVKGKDRKYFFFEFMLIANLLFAKILRHSKDKLKKNSDYAILTVIRGTPVKILTNYGTIDYEGNRLLTFKTLLIPGQNVIKDIDGVFYHDENDFNKYFTDLIIKPKGERIGIGVKNYRNLARFKL